MKFVRASRDDLHLIHKMYKESIAFLELLGIFQWDDIYPNISHVEKNIKNGAQYILKDETVIGTIVIDEEQAEQWLNLNWTVKGKALVVHGLVIKPEFQGKGYGQKAILYCEKIAKKEFYNSIRLDVFSKNPGAIRLYEKSGFKYIGDVFFEFKPEGNQKYLCYEKEIDL